MIYPFAYRKRYEDKFHHHLIADVSSFAENKSRERERKKERKKKCWSSSSSLVVTPPRDESMTRQRDTIHHPSACPSVPSRPSVQHSTAPSPGKYWR